MTRPAMAAAAGGFLLSLSFPPVGFDSVAWIAFIPLFWAIESANRPAIAGLYGAAFGFVFFLIDVRWVYRTVTLHGHFDPVLAIVLLLCLVVTLTVYPAVFAFLVAMLERRGWGLAITAPFLWTGLEYVRALALTGFPWDLLAYSQADRLVILQIADVTGVYGVSFLVMLVNGVVWEVMRWVRNRDRLPWKVLLATACALALVFVYGKVSLDRFGSVPNQSGSFGIGLLQANIPQEIKWNDQARDLTFAVYEKLAAEAVKTGAGLLVWPETAVPVIFGPGGLGSKRPSEISAGLGVPMLVGAPSEIIVDRRSRYYNSAFLVDGSSLRQRYDKMHLVPFGEYMPLNWLIPLGPGIAAREADYSFGDKMTVMSVEHCPRFSVLICYEAIFPEISRLALNNGAQLLINITNDGWFGATAAPYQHLKMARLRSIENRVWLLRCANTGISAAFDQAGRMVESIPLNQEGFFVGRVPDSYRAGSFYSRFGDLFVWGCMVIVLVLFVARPHR